MFIRFGTRQKNTIALKVLVAGNIQIHYFEKRKMITVEIIFESCLSFIYPSIETDILTRCKRKILS